VLLFAISLLTLGWAAGTLRRRGRSRALKWAAAGGILVALVPFLMLGLAYLAARNNAPAALTGEPAPGGQNMAVNMAPAINSEFRDSEPSFTADGRTMYFNCRNADICVSHLIGTWEQGSWTTPELLDAPISTGYLEVEPLISAAGDKLYFQSNRPARRFQGKPFLSPFVTTSLFVVDYMAETKLGVSLFDGLGLADVWVSFRVNGAWSEPRNLSDVPGEPPVNTAYHDHCLSFSADGDEAFWTSTRPGGYGGNDIWTSRRVDGKWSEPENLGPHVNGPGDEHHSVPTSDGRSLFVTSNREGGYGADDIYITNRGADEHWKHLVNLGPQINGPGDDRCPAWTPDGEIFLFDSTRAGGSGSIDLWWTYAREVHGFSQADVQAGASQ
jgi:hypothetical protein